MTPKVPYSPFTTRLSGSAKETELRLRSIFQWKKKRPPVIAFVAAVLVIAFCGSLVGFTVATPEEPLADDTAWENINSAYALQAAPLEENSLSPNGKYEVRLSWTDYDLASSMAYPPESVQICDTQTDTVLWECEGAYEHAALWSPDGAYLALARTARTWCMVTIIETNAWTAWDVTLPDGSAIPEYTFLPDDESWGQWLAENNFLLTVGRGNEEGQNTYRCVPVPQGGGLTGITEPLAVEESANDPSVVLAAMESVKGSDFIYPEAFGNVAAEQLAAALNAAVDNQISEAEFLASIGGAYGSVFPHWYIENAWLEGGPNTFSSLDRHLSVNCGLPENIVEVTLSEDNHRDTVYFKDETLYQLIRHKDDYEETIDPQAYEQFKDLLIPKMESALSLLEHNPGNFTGYELTRFTPVWQYKDPNSGNTVVLYDFFFGLLTDTPETIGWAGGMALDSKLRLVGLNVPVQFAVQYRENETRTAFMAPEFYYDPADTDSADWAREHINQALDQATV